MGVTKLNETKYWVWLSMIFGTGSRRIWEAMRFFSSASEAFEAISSGELNDRLSETEIKNASSVTLEKAEEFIGFCKKIGIGAVGCGDKEYPPQLRHILNPPAVLYYTGNISCLCGKRIVTSVGARKACNYSVNAASQICGELASNGIVIASGFAVGIDIASHLAAAAKGRPTVCVIGCGNDVDYPKENMRYRADIIESGGAVVSEFPPGTPPHSGNFPKRNRILAAVSKATIVFEASTKSGSIITANLAAEQGRDVFCLPPANIFENRFSGNIALLRDGAIPLYSAMDILDCFKIGGVNDLEIRRESSDGVSYFNVRELLPEKKRKKAAAVGADISKKAAAVSEKTADDNDSAADMAYEIPEDLTDIQKNIVELIGDSKVQADKLIDSLNVNMGKFMVEISELELMGVVESLPGKLYALKKQ